MNAAPYLGGVADNNRVGQGEILIRQNRTPPEDALSPPVRVRAEMPTSSNAEATPSLMRNTRLPSPLFTSGVGSLPLASTVKSSAPGPAIVSASVIASSPRSSRIVPPRSVGLNSIVFAPAIRLARSIASRSEKSPGKYFGVELIGERINDERLRFERPDIDPATGHATKRLTTLIELSDIGYVGSPALMAGLPGSNAWVNVGRRYRRAGRAGDRSRHETGPPMRLPLASGEPTGASSSIVPDYVPTSGVAEQRLSA